VEWPNFSTSTSTAAAATSTAAAVTAAVTISGRRLQHVVEGQAECGG
jgi:hypothetical protein